MGKIVERFNSISSMMAALESRKENNDGMKGASSSKDNGEGFTGTKSYEEACDQITQGWDKFLTEVKKGFDDAVRVNTNTTDRKQRARAGVVGYAPIVPNAIRGLPESMVTSERVPQKVRAVTIVYNVGVSASWSTKELIECGITVMKIVNKLELDGYRVRLTIEAMSTEANRDRCRLLVDVKDWKQPIDLKKLCFPIISPSMLRRIAFKWLETVPDMKNTGFRAGYGKPICRSGEYKKNLKEAVEDGVVTDNEYYISAYMVKDNGNNAAKIMEQAGISSLNKN